MGRKVREYYKVENGKVIRLKRECPKCGPGVFMAEHKDRRHCGKCGYTERKRFLGTFLYILYALITSHGGRSSSSGI